MGSQTGQWVRPLPRALVNISFQAVCIYVIISRTSEVEEKVAFIQLLVRRGITQSYVLISELIVTFQ